MQALLRASYIGAQKRQPSPPRYVTSFMNAPLVTVRALVEVEGGFGSPGAAVLAVMIFGRLRRLEPRDVLKIKENYFYFFALSIES